MTDAPHRRIPGSILSIALVALFLSACSSTRFVSTWKEPSAGPSDITGQKVAAFVISKNQGTRRAAEDALAREMTARGAQGIAGYKLAPGDKAQNRETVKAALQKEDVAAVVTMRLVGKEQEISSTPGTYWHAGPSYRSWGGYWGYGWGGVYEPGEIRTDTYVFIETMVYQVASGELIWAGRTKTANPRDIDDFVTELAEAVDDEMHKSGLLR